MNGTTLLGALRDDTDRMVTALAELVRVESPSSDVDACGSCAEQLASLGEDLLGQAPSWITSDGRPFLLWSFGGPTRVVLIGHLDTVWPGGTLERWPFSVGGGRATGPGTFDMKAGLVQALFGLRRLDDLDGVTIAVNADEEIGSPTSRTLIETAAAGAEAALVLEPSAAGALKVARKGVSMYQLRIEGRAAHAGLEPERGANATIEVAHQILAAERLARPEAGTTVTPTVVTAGTTANTVPASAQLHLDVRATSAGEQHRVDDELRAFGPAVPGCRVILEGGPNRPPLPSASSEGLFAVAAAVAAELGLGALDGVSVGGGSDGNFTAGIGVPTLDGLGAVGDHAHGEGEYIDVAAMAERAALLASLVQRLLGGGPQPPGA